MINLEIDGEKFTVFELTGQEALSKLFQFNIHCCVNNDILEAIYLDQVAVLSLTLPQAAYERKIAGIITLISSEPISYKQLNICLTLQPRFAKLATLNMPQIRNKQSIIRITKDLLRKVGYVHSQWEFKLEDNYLTHDYWAQNFTYGQAESCLDWLQRSLSRAGINYYFTINHCCQEKIIFCDHNIAYPYDDVPIRRAHQSKVGFFHIAEINRYLPYRHTVTGFDLMKPNQKIYANGIVSSFQPHHETWELQHYGEGICEQVAAQKLANVYAERSVIESYALLITSNVPNLFAGRIVTIHGDHSLSGTKGEYLITEVCHQATQAVEDKNNALEFGLHYLNHIVAVPLKNRYRSEVLPIPQAANCFVSHVESIGEGPTLNQQGQYWVKPHFDRNNTQAALASAPLFRILPYVGPSNNSKYPETGWHMPLNHNTEVLISHIEGDSNRPIILGAVANKEKFSPVNNVNKTHNRFVTKSGNELLMDDLKDQAKILLQTPGGVQQLILNANSKKPHISIKAAIGSINFQAKTNLIQNTKQDWYEQINRDNTHNAENDYMVKANTIRHQAKKDQLVQGKEDIFLESAKIFSIKAGKNFYAETGKEIHLISEQGDIHIRVFNGDALFKTTHGIEIIGDGLGDIIIGNDEASIRLTRDEIFIYANKINIFSEGSVVLQGKINTYYVPAAPARIPNPLPLRKAPNIPDIILNNQKMIVLQDYLLIYLNFNIEKQGPAKSQFLSGAYYKITSILQEEKNNMPRETKIYSGMIGEDSRIIIDTIDLSKPFEITLWYENDPMHYNSQGLYFIGKDGKRCSITSSLTIQPDGRKVEKKKYLYNSENIINFRKLNLTVLHPPINFNFRISPNGYIKNFWKFCKKLNVYLTKDDYYQIKKYIKYFKSEVIESSAYQRIEKFTDEQIAYLKENGNNATLFIHGYNIPYGEYGKQFDLQEIGQNTEIIGFKADRAAAIYRNPSKHILRSYINGTDYPYDEYTVNGFGAKRWWHEMSNNLNVATGQFHYQDYCKYTSVIGVAWQGNPTHTADYMADIPLAKYPGLLTTVLIKQLLQENIKVNIIAHSLGNLVLMHALEMLGKEPETRNKVGQVFLWDAAVPDNIFSTVMPKDNFVRRYYYFPNAYQGAKAFTVLYSQKDNVLGPLQVSNFKDYIKQIRDKIHDPAAGWVFALIAIVFHEIDQKNLPQNARSIYHLANLIQKPLSQLVQNEMIRKTYYQQIREKYQYDYEGQILAETLSQQDALIRRRYRRIYNQLSTIIALYEDNWWQRGSDVLEAYWIHKFNEMASLFGDASINHAGYSLFNRNANEVAALVITLFMTVAPPRPALGYSGPDKNTINLLGSRLRSVNQFDWLTSHSGMRIPSKRLMINVYHRIILEDSENFCFGKYKKPSMPLIF